MTCFSEQDLTYYNNMVYTPQTIFYMNAKDWISGHYLQARYKALVDENTLRRQIQDQFQITSDQSTFLHAFIFTTTRDDDIAPFLPLANRRDACGRTSLYYARKENHIDALLPFVDEKNNNEEEETNAIAHYRMEKNLPFIEKFITRSNFNSILHYACDQNVTKLLIRLIPRCRDEHDKLTIYFTLSMQYPVPIHPICQPWVMKYLPPGDYFIDWIQERYSDEKESFYTLLTWILRYVDGYSPNLQSLVLRCYYLLLKAISRDGQIPFSPRTKKIFIDKTPLYIKWICARENDTTISKLWFRLRRDAFIRYFGSSYLHIAAWWVFVLQCSPYHHRFEYTFQDLLSPLHVDPDTQNTLLHVVTLYKFSYGQFTNHHFWRWCLDRATPEMLQRVNDWGATAEELAAVSPYLFGE